MLLKVFFGATNRGKRLGAELMKVVLKANILALQLVEIILIGLNSQLLLLGNLFGEGYLFVALADSLADGCILF